MRSITAFAITLVLFGSSYAIPWPVGENGPDSLNSYSLMTTYGEMNNPWTAVGPGALTNFHTGIDISKQDIGEDDWCSKVWCVESGLLTNRYPDQTGSSEYRIVISPSIASDSGWAYAHVGPEILSSAEVWETEFSLGDWLGFMATGVAPRRHLHFARTTSVIQDSYPGLDNPLDYLNPPASTLEGFTWALSCPQDPTVFFLPDYPALESSGDDWEEMWPEPDSVFPDTLDRLALFGSVDLFYNCLCLGTGEHWVPGVNRVPVMPQKVEWTLTRVVGEEKDTLFTKRVVDFDGELGEGLNGPTADWQDYKQLYFMYVISDLTGEGAPASITCLTNCNEAEEYNGIKNIEENCWATNSAITPEDAMYRDGCYEVEITSFAHDSTEHVYSTDVTIDNFAPYINNILMYTKTDFNELYYAEWSGDPASSYRSLSTGYMGLFSDSLSNKLGIIIGVSEPLDPDSMPEIYLTGEWGGEIRWSSDSLGEDFQFKPCEWDEENYEPMLGGDYYYYCYETDLGITGYHGLPRLNISGGRDLSGNLLDCDPSTVALPRNASGEFTTGYDTLSVDSSYMWDMVDAPYYHHSWYPHPGKVNGSFDVVPDSTIEFHVRLGTGSIFIPWMPDRLGGNNGYGRNPYYHGFWTYRLDEPATINNRIFVEIVDFEGSVLQQSTLYTRFNVSGPPSSSQSYTISEWLLLSGEENGEYCWMGVSSSQLFPVLEDSSSRWPWPGKIINYIDVYCTSYDGSVSQTSIAAGDSVYFIAFDHDPANIDNIIVSYNVAGVNHEVTLSPPSVDNESITRTQIQDSSDNNGMCDYEFGLVSMANPVCESLSFKITLCEQSYAELLLYELSGRVVRNLYQGELPAGSHVVEEANDLPAGVYICRLVSGDQSLSRKIVVTR
jgi:hypothetical protein